MAVRWAAESSWKSLESKRPVWPRVSWVRRTLAGALAVVWVAVTGESSGIETGSQVGRKVNAEVAEGSEVEKRGRGRSGRVGRNSGRARRNSGRVGRSSRRARRSSGRAGRISGRVRKSSGRAGKSSRSVGRSSRRVGKSSRRVGNSSRGRQGGFSIGPALQDYRRGDRRRVRGLCEHEGYGELGPGLVGWRNWSAVGGEVVELEAAQPAIPSECVSGTGVNPRGRERDVPTVLRPE